jgi:hypothetical protein
LLDALGKLVLIGQKIKGISKLHSYLSMLNISSMESFKTST